MPDVDQPINQNGKGQLGENDREKVADYIFDMLNSLQKIAQSNGMTLLARILAMAKDEAKTCL